LINFEIWQRRFLDGEEEGLLSVAQAFTPGIASGRGVRAPLTGA
jgi:hypothetical protein